MDGVTDQPFRHITKKYGQPDLIYTEFTSVEGVCHGANQLLRDFLYDESQRPILAQIYGSTPEFFRETAVVLCELGFDGIDINMGCPAKNVAHSGAGAALILTPKLAQQIVATTKSGVDDFLNGRRARHCLHLNQEIQSEIARRHQLLPNQYQLPRILPVSIKTRLGYDHPVVTDWLSVLIETQPAAIALHGRTLKQYYGGLANWELIGQAAALTKRLATNRVLILGNGDVHNRVEAILKAKTYGLDGVLMGRAAMGNPGVFQPIPSSSTLPPGQPSANLPLASDRNQFSTAMVQSAFRPADIALEHTSLYETTFKQLPNYSFLPMRKHLGWYVKGVDHASDIRQALYQTQNYHQVEAVFHRCQLLPG